MNATVNPPDRPRDPAHFGEKGIEPQDMEHAEDSSLRVQLGEHLNDLTRTSLQTLDRSTSPVIEFVKRNPLAVVAAVGALAAIFAALSYRRRAY